MIELERRVQLLAGSTDSDLIAKWQSPGAVESKERTRARLLAYAEQLAERDRQAAMQAWRRDVRSAIALCPEPATLDDELEALANAYRTAKGVIS